MAHSLIESRQPDAIRVGCYWCLSAAGEPCRKVVNRREDARGVERYEFVSYFHIYRLRRARKARLFKWKPGDP